MQEARNLGVIVGVGLFSRNDKYSVVLLQCGKQSPLSICPDNNISLRVTSWLALIFTFALVAYLAYGSCRW